MKFIVAAIVTVLSSTAFSASDHALCQVRAQNAALDALLLVWPAADARSWGAGIAETTLVANNSAGATFEISVEGSRTDSDATETVSQKYAVSTTKDEKGNCVAEQPILLNSSTR